MLEAAKSDMTDYYIAGVKRSEIEIRKYEKLVNTYSFLRLFVLVAGVFLFYQSLTLENILLSEFVVLLFVVAFAFLVKQQSKFDRQKVFFQRLKAVNQNEIDNIEKHSNIYSDGAEYSDESHSYSSDLDIFGKGSLFNLVNRCATRWGLQKLAGWFSASSDEQVILERQQAVKELAKKKDWSQEFKASLLFATASPLSYFDSETGHRTKLLHGYLKLLPYLIAIFAFGSWFYNPLVIPLFLIMLTNGALVLGNQHEVNRTDAVLGRVGKTLDAYSDAFHRIEMEAWESKRCLQLSASISEQTGSNFSRELKHLSVLMSRLEYRLNLLIGFFLNAAFAWDVRQLIAIERWKRDNSCLIHTAFEALTEFEALVSLSSLHANNPDWNFPEIVAAEKFTYTAVELGHPLIVEAKRVNNNFSLEDDLKIDIVTGSNMAGKSTFLRTLGINAVLAMAGAPVCAQSMKLSVMELFAYMRIRDSLNDSISTFKAELIRLKMLLDVIKPGRKVYFLIDEMLRGTNSVDKYLGSKALIEKLIDQKAVGVIATHDLQLSQLEEKYPDYIRNSYFDIRIEEGEMIFDYKLKPGACKTFNASILLKQIGIDVEMHG
jgi:hypothetical protein